MHFPPVLFKANAAMIAVSDDRTDRRKCKLQLEQAARGGWHQGQVFFYRLPVDRPGLYTVRLTLMFYHNDERRGDGITLGVNDVLKVRLQCVETPGSIVVPINRIREDLEESMGVVEFPTVALDGEILLEAEGIYTCIGLSLVETFFHDELQQRPLVVPAVGDNGRNTEGGVDSNDVSNEARLAPLRSAWGGGGGGGGGGAGAVCAKKYASDANRRNSLQTVSSSSATAREQRYFDEWARRERLEDSAGRYCRPRAAPQLGEQGWTWAGHSERVAREREEAARKAEEVEAIREDAFVGDTKGLLQAAVDAAAAGGVSAGTAAVIASEALDRVLEESGGRPLTPAEWERVAANAGRAGAGVAKARGTAKKQPFQPATLLSPALQQQLEAARRRTVSTNMARLAGVNGAAAPEEEEFDRSELTQRGRRLLSAAAAPADDSAPTPEGSGGHDGGGASLPHQSRLSFSSSHEFFGGRSGRALLAPPPPPGEAQQQEDKEEEEEEDKEEEQEEEKPEGVGGFGVAVGVGGGVSASRPAVLASDSEVHKVASTVALTPSGRSPAYSRKASPRNVVGARAATRSGAGAGAGDSAEAAEINGVSPVPRLDSPDSDDKHEGRQEQDGSAERGWKIDPDDPIPPPRCPSRLVALLEEALHVEARSKATAAGVKPSPFPGAYEAVGGTTATTAAAVAENPAAAGGPADSTGVHTKRGEDDRKDAAGPPTDSGWSPAVVTALIADGAAAAANRARSRAERGDDPLSTLGRARWEASLGRGVLPTWLGGVAGLEWEEGTAGAKIAATAAVAASATETVSPGAVLPRSVVAQQALGSGFKAVAAYRAHEVEGWSGGVAGFGSGSSSGHKGPSGTSKGDGIINAKIGDGEGSPPTKSATTESPPGASEDEGERSLPVRFTGFTWDGITVVAKETVAGCARTARPAPPPPTLSDPRGDTSWLWEDDDSALSEYWVPGDAAAARAEAAAPEKDGAGEERAVGRRDSFGEGGGGGSGRVEGGGGGRARSPCLKVEAAFVPTESIVVDIVVPVSAGLVPRLLTLLPQMERLAKGSGCTTLPPSNPLAPRCNDADHYPPAFWPERLEIRGQASSGWAPGLDLSEVLGASADGFVRSLRGGGGEAGRGGGLGKSGRHSDAAAAAAGGGRRGNFRVVVATEDPEVEALLEDYDVETVFVLSKAPFSKAAAIQDASDFIPDDHIMFVHDADLFPPCTLPDALRQTVVQGVQAVNLLVAYDNQPILGNCLYPLSTFGPMAMYASDFRAAGGIEDANSGRWGYEDTAFLHKVMLGDSPLGVLRVHLPGLVHRWHEITPWKCHVWVWGGAPSGGGEGEDHGGENVLTVKDTDGPPRRSAADVLGA
eukprot:g7584.t1